MATKPTIGGSSGTWGTELNAFLDVSHNADGTIKDTIIDTHGYFADGSTVFNTHLTTNNTWQDLDLSSYVGANVALCYLEVVCGLGTLNVYTKPKGYGGVTPSTHGAYGVSGHVSMGGTYYYYLICSTDSSGVMQIGANANTITVTIKLIGYTK